MGMSSFLLTCEDVFIDEANAVIGECECVDDLLKTLEEAGHMSLMVHYSDREKLEFVDEIWNEFWSGKAE
jgi:hypothetical protein